MARPRLPASVLEFRGAFKHDPARRRVDPVPAGPLGPPPKAGACMTMRQAWKAITDAAPPGTLTTRDALVVEMAATLYAQWRNDPTAFPTQRLGHLVNLLAKLGLSPADCGRVAPMPSKERNEFDE